MNNIQINMVKVTELMIGDWVLFAGSKYQIHKEDFSANYNFEPIQLTPEILEKNEFKKKVWWKYRESDVTTYAIGDGFHIELSEDEFWLVDNCSDDGDYGYESNWIVEVKYVHELQHLLKIFKIDKKIIL